MSTGIGNRSKAHLLTQYTYVIFFVFIS